VDACGRWQIVHPPDDVCWPSILSLSSAALKEWCIPGGFGWQPLQTASRAPSLSNRAAAPPCSVWQAAHSPATTGA